MDYSREIYDCRDQIESDYWGRKQMLPESWELADEEPEDEYEPTEVPQTWNA
jgi:hypothetical protein